MATVYLALDLHHDREVAMKVLRPELAATGAAERFQREIKLAARLQHPHILSVHDSGEAAGRLWFTMPFVDGESLRDRLTREKQLPVDEAVRIAREASLALDYAHRHGVIHRDIKPENILLSDGQALIADFGIGRVLADCRDGRLTGTGLAIGTPSYMSPEQASAERDLDGRTDVYSLGVVLYEMLSGEPPFSARTPAGIAARRLSGDAPPLRRIRPAVPEEVERAVMKALARLPADRFARAAEFAEALAVPTSPRRRMPSRPSGPTAPTQGAPALHLHTLGAMVLRDHNGCEILGPGAPLALLIYLHASPGRSASRDHLAATFWATSDQSEGRPVLRHLARLRNVLGPDSVEDQGKELRLTATLTSDRDDFLAALGRHDFEAALAAYGGVFLPNYGSPGAAEFERWIDSERERLRLLFVRAGEGLARRALDRARPREVLDLARKLCREAPDSEPMRRLLLEVLLAARDDLGAVAEAEEIRRWLEVEGRIPEPATLRLLELAVTGDISGSVESETPWLFPELVGREREFHMIVSAWREACHGPARHIHVEARAGLGKTRLLQELGGRVRTLGGKIIYVRAMPGEQHLDAVLVGDLVRELSNLPGGKTISPSTAAELVGLHSAFGAQYPDVVPAPGGSDRIRRRALALTDLINSVAEESPLALLIDDVHWLDAESSQIITAALARFGPARVFCLTAGRPTGTGRLQFREARRILLAPLSLGDTEGLLSSLASFADAAAARRLAAVFHRATRGSPLLVQEIVQLAIDQGELDRREGTWEIANLDGFVSWLGEKDPLELRLTSLSPPARQLLLTLAATGAPLAQQEIERAASGGNVSKATLMELERRGYIAARGDRWDLAHDEVGETMLRLASDVERRAAHVARGRALVVRGLLESGVRRRAARHFVEGESQSDLRRLFRDWMRHARGGGDWTNASLLAQDLLGDGASPEQINSLVHALPAWIRWPIRRVSLGVGALALLGVIVALALR